MKILALEASTTSAKAMLYDTARRSFEEKIRPYGKMNLREKAFADETCHDAETVFDYMVQTGRELSAGQKVDIISLSGTWHGVMLCDRHIIPVTPVYPWSYTGAGGLCLKYRQNTRFVSGYYQRTGCMVNAIYPFFKVLYLKAQGINLDGLYILDQGSYHNYRLTGKLSTTKSLASGTGFFNIHHKEYDPQILQMAGLSREQFPVAEESHTRHFLSKEGASLLGIKEGTPVILTNPDGGLNQIGAGATREGIMTFSVGTSGAMRMSAKSPLIPRTPSTWCYLSPKSWIVGAASSGCCNCIDWFFGRINRERLSHAALESSEEKILDTPVFLPFLFGERCPGWNDDRQGGFELLKPHHAAGDMYRAVQQGVLFNLYQCYQALETVVGVPDRIKLSGGILHSAVWTQMCADVFGRSMEVDNAKQTSLMGAVVLARERLGDLDSAEKFETHPACTIWPNTKRTALYREQYEKYLRFYNLQKEDGQHERGMHGENKKN